MGSSPNKGYLIPNNPTPDGLNCLLVFYPDDPLYFASLMGSLTFLGTWVAWQKDGTTRAREAAEAWKEANEATMANCLEDLITALGGIQTAIENQQMTLDASALVAELHLIAQAVNAVEDVIGGDWEMGSENMVWNHQSPIVWPTANNILSQSIGGDWLTIDYVEFLLPTNYPHQTVIARFTFYDWLEIDVESDIISDLAMPVRITNSSRRNMILNHATQPAVSILDPNLNDVDLRDRLITIAYIVKDVVT